MYIFKQESCEDLEWGLGVWVPNTSGKLKFINLHCKIPENSPRPPSGKQNYPSNPLPLEKYWIRACVFTLQASSYGGGGKGRGQLTTLYAFFSCIYYRKNSQANWPLNSLSDHCTLKNNVKLVIFWLHAELSLTYDG